MRTGAFVLIMALAAPLAGQAQGPGRAQGPGQGPTEGPAERLLAHRAELSLTAEQVKKLEAIDARLEQQDRDAAAKLEALRGKPLGEPLRMRDLPAADLQKLQEKRAEMQPLMSEMRDRHQQAITEIRGVLTAEQNQRANAFLFRGPGQGQGRGSAAMGQGRTGGQGRAGMRGPGGNAGRGGAMMNHRPAGGGGRGRMGRGG